MASRSGCTPDPLTRREFGICQLQIAELLRPQFVNAHYALRLGDRGRDLARSTSPIGSRRAGAWICLHASRRPVKRVVITRTARTTVNPPKGCRGAGQAGPQPPVPFIVAHIEDGLSIILLQAPAAAPSACATSVFEPGA